MRALLPSFAFLMVAAALAPSVFAHPAAPPVEPWIRLLHDWNDDWGGHAVLSDGHDLIALDLREAYDEALGDVLIFRFVMNGGYNSDATKPELKETLTLKAGAASVSKEMKTTDNAAFTGTFDAVRGPEPFLNDQGQPDGTRFAVDGVLKLSSVGLAPGAKISTFFVQGYAGSAKADQMEGGYTQNGVTVTEKPPTETADPAGYTKPDYTIAGPSQYADLTLDLGSVDLQKGGNDATVTLTIANKLSVDQAVTLHAMMPSGIVAEFHPGAEVELPRDGSVTVHLYLTPGASAVSGLATVAMTTDQGGHVMKTLDIVVAEPAPDPAETDTGSDGDAGGAGLEGMDDGEPTLETGLGDEDADAEGGDTGMLPGPGFALVALGLVGAALLRRRK